MEKLEKGLQLLMVATVILMVLIFIVTIIIGHSTDYGFLFSSQDIPTVNIAMTHFSNVV